MSMQDATVMFTAKPTDRGKSGKTAPGVRLKNRIPNSTGKKIWTPAILTNQRSISSTATERTGWKPNDARAIKKPTTKIVADAIRREVSGAGGSAAAVDFAAVAGGDAELSGIIAGSSPFERILWRGDQTARKLKKLDFF